MDHKLVFTLVAMINFVIFASAPVYKFVKKMGVKDDDMSLIVRSLAVGLITYLALNIN